MKREVLLYNLDVVISGEYRVKSSRGTQFCIWATQKLNEILVRGYAINQKRLDKLQQTVQLIQKQSHLDNILPYERDNNLSNPR